MFPLLCSTLLVPILYAAQWGVLARVKDLIQHACASVQPPLSCILYTETMRCLATNFIQFHTYIHTDRSSFFLCVQYSTIWDDWSTSSTCSQQWDYQTGCIVTAKPKQHSTFAWHAMYIHEYVIIPVTSNLKSSVNNLIYQSSMVTTIIIWMLSATIYRHSTRLGRQGGGLMSQSESLTYIH